MQNVAGLGIAGVNTFTNHRAALGVAGVDSLRMHDGANFGIAGVDRLSKASVGIAGHFSTTIRPLVEEITTKPPIISAHRIGDRAAEQAWQRAVYLLDWTYLVCTDGQGGIRWRKGFEALFAKGSRRMPLFLDSAAFRRHTGTAPRWATYENYLKAIALIQPEGYMAWDTVGDQQASLRGYERMVADGFGPGCIPVWQLGPSWDDKATTRLLGSAAATDAVRTAMANAYLAATDPVMQEYARRSKLVAIGGMVQGPCPRTVRHVFLGELCKHLPDHMVWGLGQASQPVVNGLGQMGLLDRVWLDGSWWIHHARCEQMAVVQNGLLKSIKLQGTGAYSFFTMSELMAANLRSLLSAYAGLWVFPGPAPLPTDMCDLDAVLELKRRVAPVQLDLFRLLGQEGL